jgi:predicted phage tail protein
LWIDDVTANVSQNYRNQNLAGTSFTTAPISSSAGHSYKWWARAINANGQAGAWSDASDYVYYPLAAPTNPVDSTAGTFASTPTLTWDTVSGAGKYDVWVDDMTSGQEQVLRDVNVSDTTFTPATPLTRNDVYRFWVRAIDTNFGPGAWSAPLDFIVASLAPTLQGPTTQVIGALPTFTWSKVAGADHYDLWVDDLTTGQSQALRQKNVAGESVTPSTLTGGQNYRWWIRAIDESGVPGPWSASADFTYYTIAAPVPTGPAATPATMPTFSWNPVNGAAAYDLWVDDLTAGVAEVVRYQNVTGTSLTTPTPLAMGHAYRFWVRALDAAGNPSPWSSALDFTVPPCSSQQ